MQKYLVYSNYSKNFVLQSIKFTTMENQNEPQGLEKINSWVKNSVTLKLFIIGVLALLMLIPATMVKEIIYERQDRSLQTETDVTDNYPAAQEIIGPIISVPITSGPGASYVYSAPNYMHFLPENLQITGDVTPQKLERGIFKVVVYESALNVSGKFDLNKSLPSGFNGELDWSRAIMSIGISDLRGIKNQFSVNIAGVENQIVSGAAKNGIISDGVHFSMKGLSEFDNRNFDFSYVLDLQGSNNLSFIPVGNTTDIKVHSTWDSPSFNGSFLPDAREVNSDGFDANWHVLQLNRNYPQSWDGNTYTASMEESSFGVNLKESLNDYQKSIRSVKYAILLIGLTFLVFFLVEIRNGKRIHPFQYILVGLALCLFYTLLVSLSEQINFNLAYLISASTIVIMISLYSRSIFTSTKLSFLLFGILTALYTFLFITLQMEDYALLSGSIGLTLMLAATMYFTRNIDWYATHKKRIATA